MSYKSELRFVTSQTKLLTLVIFSELLTRYRITSNKRPGRLLNFLDFRRGVYSREAFIEKSEKWHKKGRQKFIQLKLSSELCQRIGQY